MQTYECWQDPNVDLTFSTQAGCADMRAKGLIGPNAKRLYVFRARDWNAAMQEHHRRQGWEPYKPME